MTREEFINLCTKCGYASKRVANVYSNDKTELNEDDFVEVFRINERLIAFKCPLDDDRFCPVENGRTTRKINDDSDHLI